MKKRLPLLRETVRTLTEGLQSAAGGYTTLPTYTCSALGCAGSNNSCGICYEN